MPSSLAIALKLVAALLAVSTLPAYSAMSHVPIGLKTLVSRSDAKRAASQPQCWPTTLDPNNQEYEKRCGEKSDKKHPCMTHWYGDLNSIQARPYLEPLDIHKTLYVKDNNKLDFTVDDPTHAFTIIYTDAGNTQLIWQNYDEKTGCAEVTLRQGPNSKYRIWVSEENSEQRDIDTEHHSETRGKICTKWMHIHVKKDGV